MDENQKSGLVVASLVLGIIGVVLSLIPIINNLSFVLGAIGLILGIIGIAKHNKKGLGIAGIILCAVAIAATLASQSVYAKALNQAADKTNESLKDISGDNTDDILGKDVQVDLGEFTMSEDAYGFITSSLPVTVKNLNSEAKSYSIQLEAVGSDGNRIKDDAVYASNLGAGQTQVFETFNLVTSDEKEAMKTATFKIVKVSKI
jgi:hypothetical protein